MKTKIGIHISSVDKPEFKTREDRQIEQRDRLLDKIEYAYDCYQAGMKEDAAKQCLRKCWKFLESIDDLPNHLIEVKRVLIPIIREIGAEGNTEE